MSKQLPASGAMLLTGIVVALALVTGACAPARVDLTQVTACHGEDGPAPGATVPCVWDAQTRGVLAYTPVRWVYYSADKCPVATVQPGDTVRCVSRSDWAGQ